jgi:hypothetical protein
VSVADDPPGAPRSRAQLSRAEKIRTDRPADAAAESVAPPRRRSGRRAAGPPPGALPTNGARSTIAARPDAAPITSPPALASGSAPHPLVRGRRAHPATPHTGAAGRVKLGVFRSTSPSPVRAFESWLGRDSDYVIDFSSRETWAEIAEPDYMIDAWKGTRYRMVHSAAMLPQKDATATMAKGAKGDYDRYFTTLAERLVAGGQEGVIVRLGWEFNLSPSRWSTADPAVFIGYWRHIVTAMRSVPGQKFRFVG